MEYHLSIDGKRTGPHSQFYIIEAIRDGSLSGGELVWHQGLGDWCALRGLEDFSSYWQPTPAVIEAAESARRVARAELDRPRPWLRFWARVVDYAWFTFALSMLAAMAVPSAVLPALQQMMVMHVPVDAVALLLYVPLEAWMLSRWGTTPGRALLRIRVRRLDDGVPQFAQALKRSFQVFVQGMALSLPLLSLFAMAWSRLRLHQKGVTAWDEQNETRVEHGEPEIWRLLALVALVLGLVLMVAASIPQAVEMLQGTSPLPK
ncbi:MAG: RDD family protein [Roseimicrobium sp.]